MMSSHMTALATGATSSALLPTPAAPEECVTVGYGLHLVNVSLKTGARVDKGTSNQEDGSGGGGGEWTQAAYSVGRSGLGVVSHSPINRKPILSWTKPNGLQFHKQSAPEELPSVLILGERDQFLLGGSRSGKIYLWNIATTDMKLDEESSPPQTRASTLLHCWTRAHYSSVTALASTLSSSATTSSSTKNAPDNLRLFASGGEDGVVRVFRLFSARDRDQAYRMFSGHTMPVSSLEFVNGGRTLVSCARDGLVKVLDVVCGAVKRTVVLPVAIRSLAVCSLGGGGPVRSGLAGGASSSRSKAAGSRATIWAGGEQGRLFKIEGGNQAVEVLSGNDGNEDQGGKGGSSCIHSLGFSLDGSLLVVGKANALQLVDTRSDTVAKTNLGWNAHFVNVGTFSDHAFHEFRERGNFLNVAAILPLQRVVGGPSQRQDGGVNLKQGSKRPVLKGLNLNLKQAAETKLLPDLQQTAQELARATADFESVDHDFSDALALFEKEFLQKKFGTDDPDDLVDCPKTKQAWLLEWGSFRDALLQETARDEKKEKMEALGRAWKNCKRRYEHPGLYDENGSPKKLPSEKEVADDLARARAERQAARKRKERRFVRIPALRTVSGADICRERTVAQALKRVRKREGKAGWDKKTTRG